MAELTTMRKLKWEMKKKQVKEAVTQKVHQVSDWYHENRDMLVIAIPATAATAKYVGRSINAIARKSAAKQEERDRRTRFYDHRLGCYWYTRRELRPDELLAVQRRKASGESYGDIFKSMKLLK